MIIFEDFSIEFTPFCGSPACEVFPNTSTSIQNTPLSSITKSLFVGAPRMIKSWISKIYPGKTAPWHWDWDVDWKKYTEQGNPVRFTAMINEPAPGHVFIVGDEALYNEKQGDVHKWPDFKSYHGGTNCGLVPKFNFNYLAYAE